jgi:hypothetical protein
VPVFAAWESELSVKKLMSPLAFCIEVFVWGLVLVSISVRKG